MFAGIECFSKGGANATLLLIMCNNLSCCWDTCDCFILLPELGDEGLTCPCHLTKILKNKKNENRENKHVYEIIDMKEIIIKKLHGKIQIIILYNLKAIIYQGCTYSFSFIEFFLCMFVIKSIL